MKADKNPHLSAKVIKAGSKQLALARSERLGDADAVARIYRAMCRAEGYGRISEFGKETIYNIRSAIEDMKRCERRAEEHLAEITQPS